MKTNAHKAKPNLATCAVEDTKGHNCPDRPTCHVMVDGEMVALCEQCYTNVLQGSYGNFPCTLIRTLPK